MWKGVPSPWNFLEGCSFYCLGAWQSATDGGSYLNDIDAEKTDMGSQGKPPGQQPMKNDEREADAKPGARVDANVRAHLGRKLKTAYQSLIEEPVPDRFVKLLEELRSKEAKS